MVVWTKQPPVGDVTALHELPAHPDSANHRRLLLAGKLFWIIFQSAIGMILLFKI